MGTKNATTTSTQQLPGYINDAYKNLVSSAGATGSQAYTPYTGGFTGDQQQAFQNIRDMWGSSSGAFSGASDAYGKSMIPTSQTVSSYMSPYMDEVVSKAMANMQEQNAQGQQQVVGDAIAKGAMGGNRVGVAQGELARQQKLADNQTIANLYQSGYGTALGAAQADKTAALQAGQGYTGLGQTQMQTNLAQAASQLGAGTQQQQFDYQQYLNQQAYPYQQQSWLASIIGGLGSTAGGTTTQQTPQGNIFSQLLGAGLGVASLFKDGGRVRRADGGRIPSDIDLARNPVRIMRENPFGLGLDYDAAPRLNQPIHRGDWLDMFRGPERDNLDELWNPLNGIETEYVRDIGDRPHLAVGGVPYANDNGQWPSYGALMGGSPYANDNGDFGSYIPKAVAFGGGGNFPTIQQPAEQEDPLAKFGSVMKEGASNIKGWLSPVDASTVKMPALYAGGGVVGRHGYASGGIPTLEDIYGGILLPGPTGGIVGNPALPPLPKKIPDAPTIDTVNALDGDRLGLDVNTTLPPRGEDPYLAVGGGEPSFEPIPQRAVPKIAGGNRPGEVIYGQGEQFVTRPVESTYSKNGLDAIQSLFAGKGLNVAPDVRNGLLTAGLGMMASRSPFALQGIGEGGLAGVQAWKDYQAMERENATARAGIGQKGEELAQQAELIGSNIANINASTARTDVGALSDRWSFERTPAGMMVTDKTTNGAPIFYPWGSVLPDGTKVVDSRMMSPETAGIAVGETERALQAAAPLAQNAQQGNMLLSEVEHNLATLPQAGLLTPGSDFGTRLEWAKGINTAFRMAGAEPPIAEKEVAAGEDLGKLTTRMGFELSGTLGSDNAASIVMSAIGAVPNGALSPQGNAKIINALRMANQRQIDRYNFLQEYSAANNGSLLGAEAAFNQKSPPESYAYAAIIPRDAVSVLISDPSPEAIAEFNAAFGHGTDVAKFYLRR